MQAEISVEALHDLRDRGFEAEQSRRAARETAGTASGSPFSNGQVIITAGA